MNYIYDVVLNFFDVDNFYEFYEWDENDKLLYVEKMPIFRINPIQMEDLSNYKVSINKELLNEIYNKTFIKNGNIDYSLLVTDLSKVIGLRFNSDGVLIEKSSLLLDEEDSVILESSDFDISLLEYEIIEKIDNDLYLSRYEKYIRNYLINEINKLYSNKDYDEINYLYRELYSDDFSIKDKYLILIDDITNNYSSKFNRLYEVIKLSNKGILS